MLDAPRVQLIAFDADDTLWGNEMFFRDAEEEIATLLSDYEVAHVIQKEMYAMEMQNLPTYGYGIKGFTLSMIEVATKVSAGRAEAAVINKIIAIGKRMLTAPIDLLPGVVETLKELQGRYKLIVITKGDLLDQERKLERSNLLQYFHHTEVVSDKKPADYKRVFDRLDTPTENILMIGNSLKSDVLPVLDLGAQAIHVPYHTTWEHEKATAEDHHNYVELDRLSGLLHLLK
ncbi:MAG: HAD family hydrolase [Saprospiraceae bacterium]